MLYCLCYVMSELKYFGRQTYYVHCYMKLYYFLKNAVQKQCIKYRQGKYLSRLMTLFYLMYTARFDPYKYTSVHMVRCHSLVVECLMDDEENQIRGYSYCNDESGLTMGHISLWSLSDIRKILQCIQVNKFINSNFLKCSAGNIYNSFKMNYDSYE